MNNFYPQGDYQNLYETQQKIHREKKQLRHISLLIGLGVLGMIFVSNLAGVILFSKTIAAQYENNLSFQLAVESVLAIVMIGLPFWFIIQFFDKREEFVIPFGMGTNKKFFLLFIPIGVAACFVGSMGTGILTALLEKVAGVTFTMEEYSIPTTAFGMSLFFLRSAIIPALVEEFAIRGVAMQALRKYGDKFAIVASAFIFAIMHGNMIQIPFAFVAGIAIGYAVMVTGSIWVGVIIHFINNSMSVLVSLFAENSAHSEIINGAYGVIIVIAIIVGGVCFYIFNGDKNKPRLSTGTSVLKTSEKANNFIFTVPMILSIIYMAYVTSQYIE